MKKLLFTLIIALAAVAAGAQEIGSYELRSTTDGIKTYKITLLQRNSGEPLLAIEVPAKHTADAKLIIKKSDIPKFKKYLNEVLEKCMDWKLTAINNDVDDFTKVLPNIRTPKVCVSYHYGDKHCLSTDEPIRALFIYLKQYQNVSLVLTLDGVAFDNQYIQAEVGINFVYLDDLANFINAIDLDKIEKAVKQKQVTDELFN